MLDIVAVDKRESLHELQWETEGEIHSSPTNPEDSAAPTRPQTDLQPVQGDEDHEGVAQTKVSHETQRSLSGMSLQTKERLGRNRRVFFGWYMYQ